MKSTFNSSGNVLAFDAETTRQRKLRTIERQMRALERRARWGKSLMIFGFCLCAAPATERLLGRRNTGLVKQLFGTVCQWIPSWRAPTSIVSVPIRTSNEPNTSFPVHRHFGFKGDH